MRSIDEALELILSHTKNFGVEEISIHHALNRILAEDIFADRDYPPFNRSTMDGYAVVASDLLEKKLTELKLIETIHAGDIAKLRVSPGTCIKIMTGAPIPDGADAVVRVEDCIENNSNVQFKTTFISPKQFIAQQGEDIQKGNLLIKKNIKLDAPAIAVLAVAGKARVKVYSLPSVTVVSTGNEIVNVNDKILPHQIRDSNSIALSSFLKQYNISCDTVLEKDDKIILKETFKNFLHKDILIITGGVSMGDADYVPEVLISLGVKEIFHRVKIKPGNPLWFGVMPNGGVVFGLPGNPVSVQAAFKVFIEPYLRACFNMEALKPFYLPLFNDKPKKSKFTEYFPCSIVTKNKVTGLESKKMNSSGDIAATLYSDGLAIHPERTEMMKENTIVEFYSWNS
ncbi:MAG: molybdopterin molybdenumtransferase MoeA [Bacteroidota bacterium]|nr:molybdopterin molybdenumtransferase MoeA [Bacteroidota bacterium]